MAFPNVSILASIAHRVNGLNKHNSSTICAKDMKDTSNYVAY